MRRVLLTLPMLTLTAALFAVSASAQVAPPKPGIAVARWHALHAGLPLRLDVNPVGGVPVVAGSGGGGVTASGTNVFTGSNTFLDTGFKVCDDADQTKCVTVGQLSGITTANTIPLFGISGTAAAPVFNVPAVRSIFGGGSISINSSGNIQLFSAAVFGFSSAGSVTDASSCDTCIIRTAANVFGMSSGDWFQQTPARSTLAVDYTNATTTFSNTALSVTVISGRKYTFKAVLFVSDSLAADGAKFDFNGGSAAATDFRVHCTLFDTALLLSTQATALATAFSQATVTGSGMFECYGSFEPSGAGTFIIRAAQNAHTTGTLTVFRGSNLWVEDMP